MTTSAPHPDLAQIADNHAEQCRIAARALNQALRLAAEADLHVSLEIHRQDLQDDLEVVDGTAPAVEVTISRRE